MSDASTAPPEPGILTAEAFAELTGASEAVVADLKRYRRLLEDGNAVMNLVGPASLPDFWRRHALDSAQLLTHAPDARTWIDLGSGAGLPGVVLAAFGKTRGGFHVDLVDSLKKRVRFLQQVTDSLDLPATVHDARAEAFSEPADVVTARACAPMEKLLAFAWPCLRRGATGLFLKGENVERELTEARGSWTFEADLFPSLSDPRGRIVRIRSLARA